MGHEIMYESHPVHDDVLYEIIVKPVRTNRHDIHLRTASITISKGMLFNFEDRPKQVLAELLYNIEYGVSDEKVDS